jgi:hypothetical protein
MASNSGTVELAGWLASRSANESGPGDRREWVRHLAAV